MWEVCEGSWDQVNLFLILFNMEKIIEDVEFVGGEQKVVLEVSVDLNLLVDQMNVRGLSVKQMVLEKGCEFIDNLSLALKNHI